MRALTVLTLLLFVSCASKPEMSSEEAQAEAAAEATDHCLANPELARVWGECNVKKTLFDRSDSIGACQAKYGKKMAAGETLMLKISLKPNGRVRTVKAEDGGPKNRPLERCLSREIAKLRFAPPPKGVSPVIYFPFEL